MPIAALPVQEADLVGHPFGDGADAQTLVDLDLVREIPAGDEDVGLLVEAHQRDRVRHEAREVGPVRLMGDDPAVDLARSLRRSHARRSPWQPEQIGRAGQVQRPQSRQCCTRNTPSASAAQYGAESRSGVGSVRRSVASAITRPRARAADE